MFVHPLTLTGGTSCASPPGEGIAARYQGLLCHLPTSASQWQHLAVQAWPYAAALLGLAVAIRWAWLALARRAWSAHAAKAHWLEVTPPVTASPATTIDLWKLLAGQLSAPGRFALTPKRLIFEVFADGERMRAGFLVPPGIGTAGVAQRIAQAWPGARITYTDAPRLPQREALVLHGLRLTPSHPDSLDFITETTSAHGFDPLRALYDSLARGGREGGALLQLTVQRAPTFRTKAFTQMIHHPGKVRSSSAGRAAEFAVRAISGLVNELAGIFTPAKHSPSSGKYQPVRMSPEDSDRAARAGAKQKRSPHFLLGIAVFALGENKRAARESARHIAGGFALIAQNLVRRRVSRASQTAVTRWSTQGQLALASIGEVAAVVTLPAEPPAYGMSGAASRRKAGTADGWRAPRNPASPSDDDDGDSDGGVFDPWSMA